VIASLGMYLRPQTASATYRFWDEIRDRLRADGIMAPQQLETGDAFWPVWNAPDLLLSQTCGRPFRLSLHDRTQLVGTPDYGLRGCAPGYYNSVFIVRTTDTRTDLAAFRDARFAYNEEMSQSGWAAAQCHVAHLGFQFQNLLQSGGHVASAKAVASGNADIAAIDALTWEMIKRYDGFSPSLRVLARTDPTPGLPYITGPDNDAKGLATAISDAIAALDLADRRTLRLQSLIPIPASTYLAVPNP